MDWLHSLRMKVGIATGTKKDRKDSEVVVPNTRESKRWVYEGSVVEAATRSEARAKLKSIFGLKRLPVGAKIDRVR